MSTVLSFVPELFGLTGTAATVASGATALGLGMAAKDALTPDVPAMPKAPKSTVTSPQAGAAQQVQSEQAAEMEEMKKRRGRRSTISTSGLGLLTAAPLDTKKLLGQ